MRQYASSCESDIQALKVPDRPAACARAWQTVSAATSPVTDPAETASPQVDRSPVPDVEVMKDLRSGGGGGGDGDGLMLSSLLLQLKDMTDTAATTMNDRTVDLMARLLEKNVWF
jgi:hypothetical protein